MAVFEEILIIGVFDNILSYLSYWEIYYLTFSFKKMIEYTRGYFRIIHCGKCEPSNISVKAINQTNQIRKLTVKCSHGVYTYSTRKI
jgi:hypothetical protein